MKAAMFASVRRGLLMEELARHIGDQEMRNELFICGVFSLLDRLFQQPLAELLRTSCTGIGSGSRLRCLEACCCAGPSGAR